MLQYLLIIYIHAPFMMSDSTTAIKSVSNCEEKPCIFDIILLLIHYQHSSSIFQFTQMQISLSNVFNLSITQMQISLSNVLIMLSRIVSIAIYMVYIE